MHPFLLSFHFFFPCQLFIHTLHSTAIASRETCSQVGFGVWGWLQGQSICGESFFSGGGGLKKMLLFSCDFNGTAVKRRVFFFGVRIRFASVPLCSEWVACLLAILKETETVSICAVQVYIIHSIYGIWSCRNIF